MAAQGLGDLRLPDPDKDRRRAWADGLPGLGRDGPNSGREAEWLERGTAVIRAQAGTLNQGTTATTLMRAYRRSLWRFG